MDDLEQLIRHLKLQDFHLYGHSYGGIVAYEYVKRHYCSRSRDDVPHLRSVTLCSAPSNIRLVDEESKLLMKSLDDYNHNHDHDLHRLRSDSNCSMSSSIGNTDEEEGTNSVMNINKMDSVDTSTGSTVADKSLLFQHNFVCRTSDGILPAPLQEAYSKMGKVFSGTDMILDYVAEPLASAPLSKKDIVPVLLMRGEYDFVSTKYCFDEWRNLFQLDNVVCKTLKGCSHYSMCENPRLHSMALNSFLHKCEKGEEVGEEEEVSCVSSVLQSKQ